MPDVEAELQARAESDGVEFFFAMFVDMHGKPCAKMIPATALDVLLGEAMWADMLTASLCFRCPTKPAAVEKPAQRQPAIVLPFEPRAERAGMPVLAAFDTVRVNGHADAYQPGRNSHAYA